MCVEMLNDVINFNKCIYIECSENFKAIWHGFRNWWDCWMPRSLADLLRPGKRKRPSVLQSWASLWFLKDISQASHFFFPVDEDSANIWPVPLHASLLKHTPVSVQCLMVWNHNLDLQHFQQKSLKNH